MLSDIAEETRDPRPDATTWDRIAEARRRITHVLSTPPPGHSVFHDLELPRPSRSVIDHLVVGPRDVVAITVHVADEPIVRGGGRNDDTLFEGRSSLRPVLDAVDLDAAALAELIGRPVEPIVVCVAPDLPAPSFDFRGISICEPDRVMALIGTPNGPYVDVEAVHATIDRVLRRQPDHRGPVPTLGAPTVPPVLRPTVPAARRRPARPQSPGGRRSTWFRLAVVGAALAIGLVLWPTMRSTWTSVSTTGSEIVADALEQDDSTNDAATDAATDPTPRPVAAPPAVVGATLSCATSGGTWQVDWSWPGPPVTGADGYGLRSQRGGEAATVHTLTTWIDPTDPPLALVLAPGETAELFTEHRTANGSVVRTSTSTIAAPAEAC